MRLWNELIESFQQTKQSIARRCSRFVKTWTTMPRTIYDGTRQRMYNSKFAIINAPVTIKERWVWSQNYVKAIPLRVRDKAIAFQKITLKDIKNFFIRNAIFLSLIVVIIAIICKDTTFLTAENIVVILKQSSTKLIIALGTGIIIVARGTDLSAGRAVGLTALVTSVFSQKALTQIGHAHLGISTFGVVMISMFVGVAVGFINGLMVSKFSVDPFIATLSMMLLLYGVNMYFTEKVSNSQAIGQYDEQYSKVVSDYFMLGSIKVPYLIIIAFATAFLMWVLWAKTPFGKKVFAVGGNPKAAAVSGISVGVTLLITYMIGGAMYGIGGSLEAWRAGSAGTDMGTGYELDAIAACIVGGLSFTGGKGKISGIIVGVLIFQTIAFGFTYIMISSSMINIIKGIIIAVACSFDMIKNKVRK